MKFLFFLRLFKIRIIYEKNRFLVIYLKKGIYKIKFIVSFLLYNIIFLVKKILKLLLVYLYFNNILCVKFLVLFIIIVRFL